MSTQDELRELTTLRTGGRAEAYFRPADTAELCRVLKSCAERDMPWRVLGGGSNLLVDDGVLPGALIHIHAPGFAGIERTDGGLRVGAGVPVARMLARCRRDGLAGLEFLAGLPGTLGGALAGNAGAWGSCVGEHVSKVSVVTSEGRCRSLAAHELNMSYRHSGLRDMVITSAELAVEPQEPALVAARMRDYLQRRRGRHPLGAASAGCIFKNPPNGAAGKMLDESGMKGACVGDAAVSETHANFIINRGRASAADVLALIRRMRRAVRDRFGVELELEVQHWRARDASGSARIPQTAERTEAAGVSRARGAA
jgi:UDP-N-acetylmuramate dehydrogenase